MDERRYASWIAAYAEQHAADRREVIAFARAAPIDTWALPVGDGTWTRKDVLAHLAGGNDRMLQTILRAVIEGTPLEAADLDPDTDAENSRGVAARRSWSIARVLDQLERDEDELQGLLTRLTDEHEHVRWGAMTYTLGELFRAIEGERHDLEHLAQIRD